MRGSGPSQGHTDWLFDFVSKVGVASVSPKAWGLSTNPEGGGTEVNCWEANTNVARGSGADVCANSGPSSEKESHSGPMRHASVPSRHATGGAVPSPLGVVARGGRQIAKERDRL